MFTVSAIRTDAYKVAARSLKASREQAELTADSAAEAMDAFQDEVRTARTYTLSIATADALKYFILTCIHVPHQCIINTCRCHTIMFNMLVFMNGAYTNCRWMR